MVQAWTVGVVALGGFSALLQGCGSSGGGTGDLRSCSKADPSGSDLNALHKMNWGYRISGKAPLLYTFSKPIFQLCSEDVDLLKSTETKMTLTSSTSASDTNTKVGADVSVSASWGCFSAAASVSTERTSTSKVKQIRLDRKIWSKMYHVALTTSSLYEKLTEEARNTLKNEEPARIVDQFGEFYATEADFGGLLMATSLVEMSEHSDEESIKAEAEAKFGVGGLKVGVHSYSASSTYEAKEHRELTILGGDQTPWLAISNSSGIPQAQEAWAKTVKGDDMFVIGTKLKPIWELLKGKDDTKAKAIQDFLTKRWNSQSSIEYGEDGNFAPKKKVCDTNFDWRQKKDYPGVAEAEFFCTTTAPTCTASESDCEKQHAFPDHWSHDCDGKESSCWTGNKIVCLRPTKCCDGYTLKLGECKANAIQANVTIV